MNQHHLVGVTDEMPTLIVLRAHYHPADVSSRTTAIRAAARTCFSLQLASQLLKQKTELIDHSCFRSFWCTELLDVDNTVLLLEFKERHEPIYPFFCDTVCQSALRRIFFFHSYHVWVRGEERVERCQCTNRQFR